MLTRRLDELLPGTTFRLEGPGEVLVGTLVDVNECEAKVRIATPATSVRFEDRTGNVREFRSCRSQIHFWAPATCVEPISFRPIPKEDFPMSATKTESTRKPAAKATTKKAASAKRTGDAPRAKKAKLQATDKPRANGKPKADTNPKPISALEAAAKVLAEAKGPMNTKEMIDAMAAQGLWKSPGGKTPHATLYSAILREIGTKGKEARFKKTERGKFTSNT